MNVNYEPIIRGLKSDIFSTAGALVNSMLFVQFPWPLLAIIEILTKDLHLFSPHNMFRRLAPCSRGGFEMNGKLCNRHQTLYLPPERKSGGKYLQKHNALKNLCHCRVCLSGKRHLFHWAVSTATSLWKLPIRMVVGPMFLIYHTGCPKKTHCHNAVGATVHWLNNK